jgi:hypothetical protein
LHYLNANVFTAQKSIESAEAELKLAIEIDDSLSARLFGLRPRFNVAQPNRRSRQAV